MNQDGRHRPEVSIQLTTTHVVPPEGLVHRGRPGTLSGKVAFEVIDVETGKRSWVRDLKAGPKKVTVAGKPAAVQSAVPSAKPSTKRPRKSAK